MALEIGTRLGPYEITASIGAGGMGEVYRATDTKLKRDVAIKVLPDAFTSDPDRLARFEREAQILAALNHPNIGHIYGLQEAEGTKALVLELVEGPTLADRISQGPIPLDEALPIASQIAEALEAAHEQGIIHRDLKPANVKVRADGTVKVLDFGLAKAFQPDSSDPNLSQSPTLTARATQTGVILGTAAYMSPEQARGKPVDKRSDIWAFGSVLYEMLGGRRAFRGEDVSLTLAEVMKGEPEWSDLPTATSESVRRLLRRCVEKEPRRRLRDIGEARILLEDALSGSPADEEPRTRQAAKRPWGWIAASAASLLILVAVLVFDRPVPSTERVLRYSIPLPQEELTFSHALSPDGRYVAVQSVVNRNTQIFVRALDSWDLQPLPGTEGVTNLFWSPDSRYIAFFADEKLKQVAVNGGPSEELCDVPGLLGARGAWGRNDVIVFAPSNKYKPGPLRTVAATGGESSPLTTVEPGENHRFPVFLPDGRHFLYTIVGGSSPGIYLASLDDVDGRRLLADASSVHFAPAPVVGSLAHLLFIRDENVMAQPFDTGRLELTGDPFLLLEDVPYADDGAVEISVSDNRILSYRSGSNRETDSRFTWFDRSGNAISHEGPVGPAAAAALSPDEEAIAVTRRPPGSWTSDLYLRDLTRGIENRLTFHNAVDVATNAVWSPESRRIAFSANPGGTFDLYWKETRSSDPAVLLLETENPKYVSDWSRDGRYVLYTELDPETGADLWYLPLEREGAESEVLASEPVVFLQTEFLESAGQLSPDGRWIAYVSTESGERDVYVRPFPTGAGKWKISNGASVQPRWSPDGSELFYLTGPSSRQTVMSAAVTTPGSPASGGPPIFDTDAPEPLFDVQANAFHPATGTFFYSVSVDGQRFLINHVGTTEDPVLNVVTNWQLAFVVPPAR